MNRATPFILGIVITLVVVLGLQYLPKLQQGAVTPLPQPGEFSIVKEDKLAFGNLPAVGMVGQQDMQDMARSDMPIMAAPEAGGGVGMDKMDPSMIYPEPFPYVQPEINYTVTATAPNVPAELPVYKADRQARAIDADELSNLLDFPSDNLFESNEVYIDNLNVRENRDHGYTMGYNSYDNSVYIGRDYATWPELSGPDYWNRMPTMKDLPSDEEAIRIANEFLNDRDIDVSELEAPVIDESWKNWIPAAAFENPELFEMRDGIYPPYSLPMSVAVLYGKRLNNMEVTQWGGASLGLVTVYINVFDRNVDSMSMRILSGLSESAYPTLSYEDAVQQAEQGGMNPFYGGMIYYSEPAVMMESTEGSSGEGSSAAGETTVVTPTEPGVVPPDRIAAPEPTTTQEYTVTFDQVKLVYLDHIYYPSAMMEGTVRSMKPEDSFPTNYFVPIYLFTGTAMDQDGNSQPWTTFVPAVESEFFQPYPMPMPLDTMPVKDSVTPDVEATPPPTPTPTY